MQMEINGKYAFIYTNEAKIKWTKPRLVTRVASMLIYCNALKKKLMNPVFLDSDIVLQNKNCKIHVILSRSNTISGKQYYGKIFFHCCF